MTLYKATVMLVLQLVLLILSLAYEARGQGFPGHWVARWIWTEGEADPYHFFLMARRDLKLDGRPREAVLKVTAADRYLLYVNGVYLGRGPARSDPRWKSYDSYEVAAHLRQGDNTVAILAYHYGCHNNYTRDARAGLFAQLEVDGTDGERQIVGTGRDWRVRPAQGWRRDVDPINDSLGVTEIYDANLDPPDWTLPGYDDSSWAEALVIPEARTPWTYLEPRQTPRMVEEEVYPTRVVQMGEVMEVPGTRAVALPYMSPWKETQVPEQLMQETHHPLQHARIQDSEAVLRADGEGARLQSAPYREGEPPEKGVRSPFLIVDFGRPLFGFPKVRMKGPGGVIVDLTYGSELVQGRIWSVMQGMRLGDRYVSRPGQQVWQTFEYKQFRYLQIVVRNAEHPVQVDSISVVAYRYPAQERGSFECSDRVLTRLWRASVDTAYLNMEDSHVAENRERRVWGGDGVHGAYASWAAYGDLAITKRFFRLLSRGQLRDGLLRKHYPGSEAKQDGLYRDAKKSEVYDNPRNIPQHGLLYGVAVGDHYQYFGDLELVRELYPTLSGLAEWCRRHADDTGLLYWLPYSNWVDHVDTDMRGANLETNAFYFRMLTHLEGMARDLRRDEEAVLWRTRAREVRQSLRRLHWDRDRELYVDSVREGKQSSTATELSNALVILYGIAEEGQRDRIASQLSGPGPELVRATPLYFHYVIEALLESGAVTAAVDGIRDRYAPMMQAFDVPTMWETWDRFGFYGTGASQVHSGSSGPAWTLSRCILGVYSEGPGFRSCRIEPKTGGLDWARGTFPSVRGNIEVEWRRENQRMTLEVELPQGLETKLILVRDASRDLVLVHNGRKFRVGAGVGSVPQLELSSTRIGVQVIGGRHHLDLAAADVP